MPAFRVKLYVPFAVPLLRLKQKLFGHGYVKSYVKAKMLTHDKEQAAAYQADGLIFRQIAINILLDLYDTSTRLIADAGAIFQKFADAPVAIAPRSKAPGLLPPITGRTYVLLTNGVSDAVFYAADEPLGHGGGFQGMADNLENHFKLPIIDQTGIIQHFQINLHWPEDETHKNLDGAKQAVLEQLGVELVSTNMPIKMLVVEKVQ